MAKNYDSNNIFAKIIRGEVPSDKVYEDDKVFAFHDISKAAPIHVLVIPKGEFVNFADFVNNAGEKEVANFFAKIAQIAQDLGLEEKGYRLITNSGDDASQTVHHFHVHIIGGRNLGGLVQGDSQIR